METFLFCARRLGPELGPDLCRRAEAGVQATLPRCEVAVEVAEGAVSEAAARWRAWRTAPTQIDWAVGPTWAVLAWGLGPDGEPLAATLLERCGGGVDAARRLDASFGAVLVDRRSGEVHVVHDLAGHRTLRVYAQDDLLLVSPHDASLLATGAVPLRFDPISAASILGVQWSLGGHPLVQDVINPHPAEALSWSSAGLRRRWAPELPARAERAPLSVLATQDPRVDAVVASMRDDTERFLKGRDRVEVDLTAGMDSRAALALALASRGSAQLAARTVGAPWSVEVQTARSIVARCPGLEHVVEPAIDPRPDDFERHLDLLAFCMNGDTNGKRAADAFPARIAQPPRINGTSGAVFKGKDYARLGEEAAALTPSDAQRILSKRVQGRLLSLPFDGPDLRGQVEARLEAGIQQTGRVSDHGADQLDLFFAWESIARYGAMKSRLPFTQPTFSPFDGPGVLRGAFAIGPPLGLGHPFHLAILERYLPRAAWVPVNHFTWLPLQGPGLGRRLGRALRLPTALPGVLRAALPRSGPGSHEAHRAQVLRRHIPAMRTLLFGPDAVSHCFLEARAVEGWLDAHASGRRDHLQVLGRLLSIEAAWRLYRTARAAA